MTEFGPERECFANYGRSTWQRIWRRFVSWDSNPLIQALSSSLNLQTSRFLASFVRNSRNKPEGRRWSFKDKVLALFLLKHGPISYTFLHSLFPLPFRLSLQTIIKTVHFRMSTSFDVFNTLRCTLQTMSVGDHVCVVSCLIKCQSERTCISIRSLAVLRALRTLEATARQAVLHIIPWS